MGVLIRLLGPPHIERNGIRLSGPRGTKAWALFAYLILNHEPAGRRHLAELLFAEAADPLAALRWNLAELRRGLLQPDAFTGDPVHLRLRPGTVVDVLCVLSATPEEVCAGMALHGELLEAVSVADSPAFEAWLLAERRRVATATEAVLREQVLLCLAADDGVEASRNAARLVAANPFEEAHHELLIRSLLAAGDHAAAAAQVRACAELFRRELGTEPSHRLQELLESAKSPPPLPRIGARAAARAQIEAGQAALAAGAVQTGIHLLRRAAPEAEAAGDEVLSAQALLALGGALVHTMRGHEEAAAVLHRAAAIARRRGDRVTAATAYREVAFIDVQAGRRQRARVWLSRAEEAAEGVSDELASVYGVRGMDLSDSADYPEAVTVLEQSLEHAHRVRGQRQAALSHSLLGRVHLLTGRYRCAREHLDRSLQATGHARWLAFSPWPEALLAQVDIEEERIEPARRRLEHAFAMACQLGDPCWEGVTARGLGIAEARGGDLELALTWLADARKRCLRPASPYQWVHGWILDGLAETALGRDRSAAVAWVAALESLATRGAMREFAVRACLHRHRLGDSQAIRTAHLLAGGIDNPRLRQSMR
jgi:DNA-binding SARP family transcriptional activator